MKPSAIMMRCILILTVSAMLTGCWDRKEIDELALVMASGIDMTDDDQIELTLQIALPTGMPGLLQGSAKGKPVMAISVKGSNAHELIGQLQQRLSRKIFFGHRGIVIIGESFARHGIDQVLDTLLRFPESRYNSYILTTQGASAKEILQLPYHMELIPAIGMKTMQAAKYSTATKIDEFLNSVSTHEIQPYTAAIRRTKMQEGESGFEIDQTAVYLDNKLVGYLSGKHLKAFRMMHDQAKRLKLAIKIEPEKKFTKGTLTVDILHFEKNIRTFVDAGGSLQAEVSVRANSRVSANDTTLNLSKTADLTRAESALSQELHDMIAGMISQTQDEFKSDVVGFGKALHTQHPEEWKKLKSGPWLEAYPKMSVRVNAELRIVRVGRTQESGHLLEER
ncbi:Ger(x)C family spore germination protein [Paenibacillus hamazuiensis]|uniref:Ger(x)C family spore germination protein n=1 Tax=Paenibacillus hamazuiensis TaxID=2936508 RepID=UPI002010035D|nr:Ger(x)C family spore germination protein [Paenibacillus hamazuiensis]